VSPSYEDAPRVSRRGGEGAAQRRHLQRQPLGKRAAWQRQVSLVGRVHVRGRVEEGKGEREGAVLVALRRYLRGGVRRREDARARDLRRRGRRHVPRRVALGPEARVRGEAVRERGRVRGVVAVQPAGGGGEVHVAQRE